jgi:hypothetical protein
MRQSGPSAEPTPPADARRLLILWSPPRCRSTAFLRMMAGRGDVEVVHEPFSQLMDFGSADVSGARCADEQAIMTALLELSQRTTVFVKDTTDFHYPGLLAATDFLRQASHAVLIRDPREAIASHARLNPEVSCADIGFERVREIYQAAESAGATPLVIDSDDLVDRPADTVRAYCAAVGIEFQPQALQWEPAALSAWERAARWHVEAAGSTGFTRSSGSAEAAAGIEADPRLGAFYRHHLPHYEWLRARKLAVPAS